MTAMCEVLTVAEVAEVFGVSKWTIGERVRRGLIPNVGFDRSVRIPRHWVNEQLQREEHAAAREGSGAVTVALTVSQAERLCALVEHTVELTENDRDAQLVEMIRSAITDTIEAVAS